MYRSRNISIFILASLALIYSCSPTKNKWLNRKYHTLTGHFNVYFNGQIKLEEAVLQIEGSHQNNFNKILDVFPLGSSESAKAAGNVLDEAIKKFSKTIQMHTIGSFTDDAYYSIGKSRFYKEDYFASIETFQYVIGNYKNGTYSDLSACWIARNYIGLNKLGEAEALMGLLLSKKTFKKNDLALIYATAADINIKQEKYTTAIDNLKKALQGKLTKDQKIRYNFILGQLCLQAGKKPEASYYFNKVIKYIPIYEYAFNANINLTRIFDENDPRSINRVKKNLRKMARDEKNLDYLDQIYFEMGKLDLALKNQTEAIKDFKKSVSLSTKNKSQKGASYYELAKLYFARKEFKYSQAYYDSTVLFFDPKNQQFKQINETKTVLSELINNLTVYETEDSLQKLALLSKDELERKVASWIAEEKRIQELAAKEAKKLAKTNASLANNQVVSNTQAPVAGGMGDNSWYFYNPNLVNSGASEFFSVKKWGQRQNEDYWRIAAKEKIKIEPELTQKDSSKAEKEKKTQSESNPKSIASEPITGNSKNTPENEKWVKNIPFSKEQKNRSNSRMIESLNNLGMMYYDRLKNPEESKKYYDILEKKFPKSEYEPYAFYYLFKSLTDLKNTSLADQNKNYLISQYPEHPLALRVQNKTIASAESTNNKLLLAAYHNMFESYKSGNYNNAIQIKADIEKDFPGNTLQAKVDFLAALCIGKVKDKESYKLALTSVSNTYKGMDVAKTADEYLAVLSKELKKEALMGKDSGLSQPEFDVETETPFYYILAIKNPKVDFNEFVSLFTTFNEAYASNNNLKVNAYMSNEGYQLLTIREFPNLAAGYEYLKTLRAVDFRNKKLHFTESAPEYLISTNNFKTILKENKVEKFAEFFKKQESLLNQKK